MVAEFLGQLQYTNWRFSLFYNYHTVCFVVGITNTGAAINQTARIGFNETNGARPRSQGIPRVLVVLTDGPSDDNVKGASQNVSLNCELQ